MIIALSGKIDETIGELEEEWSCPVCLCIKPNEKLYMCTVGHVVCQTCHNSLTDRLKCPTCRGPIDKAPPRNHIVEKAAIFTAGTLRARVQDAFNLSSHQRAEIDRLHAENKRLQEMADVATRALVERDRELLSLGVQKRISAAEIAMLNNTVSRYQEERARCTAAMGRARSKFVQSKKKVSNLKTKIKKLQLDLAEMLEEAEAGE